MKMLGMILTVLLLGCGGSAEGNRVESAPGTEAAPRSAAGAAAASPAEEEDASAAEADELPLRTIRAVSVPDPCGLLTAEDASEILGEPVGPPRQPDAGGYPCVYRGESGDSQIALDMSLARGPDVEDTQLNMSLEYCQGEAVADIDDLGLRAALFRMNKENCGSDTFWVSTGIYFEATERPPNAEWIPKGYIHFTFSLRPEPDDEVLVEKLSMAAGRALARLPE